MGSVIFKIELEKAYDRVSWAFLEKTLLHFNFDDNWVKLVMSCVMQRETSILWNGELLYPLYNDKGLGHGDSLSPYLFALCLEFFSNPIEEKVSQREWVDIKPSPTGPNITHLLFANNIILFV